MTNCPPNYKNIQCESFGNKRKITSQLLRQFCKNDAYLKEQIDLLWDATDPETRKRFYPPDYMDIENSFGVGEHSLTIAEKGDYFIGNKAYNFNTIDKITYEFDFQLTNDNISPIYKDGDDDCITINNDGLLDLENNYGEPKLEIVRTGETATLRPPLSLGTYEDIHYYSDKYATITETTTQPKKYKKTIQKTVETLGKAKKDAHYYGANGNWHCNCHWYNGFDRTKNYNIKAKWKKDPYGEDKNIVKKYGRIPSVCHAQTFKAQSNGKITKVSLHIQGDKKAVSPCVVEIRTTTKKGYPTSKILARVEQKISGSNVAAFEFKKDKAQVKKGETYAIVIRSPFSHFEKCYRIGGWTTGCFSSASKYYKDGSSFTSTDNGYTWHKNGKTSDTKSYGSHYYDWGINQPPVDFAFEVYVAPVSKKTIKKKVTKTKKDETTTKKKTYNKLVEAAHTEIFSYQYVYFKENSYYMYLKPITCNPIDWFTIEDWYVQSNGGNEFSDSKYWHWEYYNPKQQEWVIIPDSLVDFNNTNTNYTVLKLRCRCDITKNTFGAYVDTDETLTSEEESIITAMQGQLDNTPLDFMSRFKLTIGCKKPDHAYLRTKYYIPMQTEILGANIWSEIGVQAKTYGNATLDIDVIHKRENVEHILFYDLNLLGNIQKQPNPETLETEYYDNISQSAANNETGEFYNRMEALISEFEGQDCSYANGKQIIQYVFNAKENNTGFIEWCMKQTVPVYYLPVDVNSWLNANVQSAMPYRFFTTVTLPDIPAYPLMAGDIGGDDIIIEPSNSTNLSPHGFIYWLPKPVNGITNSFVVSYKSDVTCEMTGEVDGVQQAINDDDGEGFEVNPETSAETIIEHLTGIVLEETSEQLFQPNTDTLKTGLFLTNENDTHPSNYIDYALTSDGSALVFNAYSRKVNLLFPNLYNPDREDNIDPKEITGTSLKEHPNYDYTTTLTNDSIKDIELKLDLITKTYQEFIDFEVDYDTGEIIFYSGLSHGDFKVTYNPLWVRGLSVADFPLKMDLWKEDFVIGEYAQKPGVYKRVYDTKTNEPLNSKWYPKTSTNPFTGEFGADTYYQFKLTVPPRDNIRKLVINRDTSDEKELVEDVQFFVDYQKSMITLYMSTLSPGDTITVHYTPNLTDDGLALGFRLHRPRWMDGKQLSRDSQNYLIAQPKDEDDILIGMNYFTYRT